jgi:hypothetical protein
MKTTVDLPDSLFQEAKACAESRGMSFRQIMEEGLRAVIQSTGKPGRFRLRDGSFGRAGSRGTQHTWPAIRETIYEGRGE